MKILLISLFFGMVWSDECTQYLSCNDCVIHNINSDINLCTWMGSVEKDGNSKNGTCYSFDNLEDNICKNPKSSDIKELCSKPFRKGNNNKIVCSENFFEIYENEKKILFIWTSIFISVLNLIAFVLYSIKIKNRNFKKSLLYGILFPWIGWFFFG